MREERAEDPRMTASRFFINHVINLACDIGLECSTKFGPFISLPDRVKIGKSQAWWRVDRGAKLTEGAIGASQGT